MVFGLELYMNRECLQGLASTTPSCKISLSTYLWFFVQAFSKINHLCCPATNQIKLFGQMSYEMWRTIQ